MPLRFELKSLLLSATVAFAVLLPGIASATLGEPESSIQADGQQLQGSIKESDYGSYRVHEIELPSGTLVREYSGLDGVVFAVTWRGPFVPNLRQTLGRYFEAYVTAANAKHADHHHLQIQQSDLVVQASGHMRAFTGRAYLPPAIPAGVSLGDLQ
ncbi:MAG: DUF2844 domain-containing protein [Steroidobacteraceae bacterium]